jgi:L-iditol 2-dehydrogenase
MHRLAGCSAASAAAGNADADGAMLEPLGVAIHAGPGPPAPECGGGYRLRAYRCLVQLALASGQPASGGRSVAAPTGCRAAGRRYAVYGDIVSSTDAVGAMGGVDVAFGSPVLMSARALTVTVGARVVLVGIPETDQTSFPASLARRKGLTLVLARRMGDVYHARSPRWNAASSMSPP